jgi:hypothetical protein
VISCHLKFSSLMPPDLRVEPTVLAEPDDAELAWLVIAPSYEAADIYNGEAAFLVSLQPLTAGQRALLAIHWCVAEVENGGFLQFFDNPTAVVTAEAVAGFRLIGVPEVADLVLAASEIMRSSPPRSDASDPASDEEEETAALDALREQLLPLDDRFYELADETVYKHAANYVRAHPEEFVRA